MGSCQLRLAAAALVVPVFGITLALAAEETFTKPTFKGYRLAYCSDQGSGCGKRAANALCQYLGLGDASKFEIDPDIGRKTPTRMIGNNQICNKPHCDGFKVVSCTQPVTGKKTFDKPKWKGYRLDSCVKKGVGCGWDAADQFCRANSFARSTSFTPALHIGRKEPTRRIGSGEICNTVICSGFQSIACVAK